MLKKIEPFLFGIYYVFVFVFVFVSVFVFVFTFTAWWSTHLKIRAGWGDRGWAAGGFLINHYVYALNNMHNMQCFFAPSHDVWQWLCLINHCVCSSCFLPSLPAQTLLSMISIISPTRRLSLVINKHCGFLQLHNMFACNGLMTRTLQALVAGRLICRRRGGRARNLLTWAAELD